MVTEKGARQDGDTASPVTSQQTSSCTTTTTTPQHDKYNGSSAGRGWGPGATLRAGAATLPGWAEQNGPICETQNVSQSIGCQKWHNFHNNTGEGDD